MARLLLLASMTALLALAGCSSSPAQGEAPAPLAQAMPLAPEPAAPAEPAPPTVQEEDLAWTAALLPCFSATLASKYAEETYRPELAGLAYGSFAVDPATWNGTYAFELTVPIGTAAAEVLFWDAAVGPGGNVVGRQAALVPDTGSFLEGVVPAGAGFASISTCGTPAASAHYVGTGLAALLAL